MNKNKKLTFNKKLLQEAIKINVTAAINEDLKKIDKTSEILPAKTIGLAKIQVKQVAILCGSPWVDYCFHQIDKNIRVIWHFKEGSKIQTGDQICTISGNYNRILMGERIAINFLQTLSGTASTSNLMNLKIKRYKAQLFDTRKTIPGLRVAQKYAVQIGGAFNQRFGLYDKVLIKENHIKSIGSISQILKIAKKKYSLKDVQIEVETFKEFKEALEFGATNILLDNFSLEGLTKAVQINKKKAVLEASGNIDINNIIDFAKTKVDRISIGALTKNIKAVDFSMSIKIK
ncbi:carboxylating nicotinate-nucleotide diphosphorylase [Methylophilaceae bacterium]|jgi:nicotinate-nucleotide pyrophosphorylase (carboxylating)|nr:carboxylating nicotinate-nucleotide diphosphorylase [Methylophilaceae bacterium]